MSKQKNKGNVTSMNKTQFKELMTKLDALIKVTAAGVFKEDKRKGIIFLSNIGLSAKEVAIILDTSEGYVYNVNSEARKGKGNA